MSSPDLTDAERQAVLNVLQTPNLSMGPQITAFENAFKSYTGVPHAIGVNSGTAGLHLCVRAAGIGAGDLVLTTPFSFVASSNALLFEQAIPVFVDVDPLTGNMDPQLTAQAAARSGDLAAVLPSAGCRVRALRLERPLKAILGVDVFGQPADWDALQAIADQHQLRVIEDSLRSAGGGVQRSQSRHIG